MATQLSQLGLEVDKVDTGDIPTGASDKVLLYASGSGSDTKLYIKEGSNTQKQLGFDIDQLSELDSTDLDDSNDHFAISDAGDEKKITFANLKNAIYADVSSEVTIAAGGAATVADNVIDESNLKASVAGDGLSGGNGSALAVSIAGLGSELSSATLADTDEFAVSDGGTMKKIDFQYVRDSVFDDITGDVQIAAGGAAVIQTGAVEHAMLAADCVDGDNIGDDVVNSEHIALGALDSEHYATGSIESNHLKGSVANAKLANSTISGVSLGSNLNNLTVDDSSIKLDSGTTFNGGAARTISIKDLGVTNAMLAGSIANAKLANDSVTVGSTEIDLGASSTVLAGITQLTASNIQVTNLDVVTLNSVSQTETTLEVADKLIVAALSASSANSDGGGLKIGGGQNSAGNASILYDHNGGGVASLDFNLAGTTEVKLVDGAFLPQTNNDVDLGSDALEFKDLYIDGVAYLDEVDIDAGAIDGAVIGANSAAAGTFTTLVAGGNVDLGDATSDTITATGRFDSDLVPSTDSARDLGSSALQWAEAHIDHGYIDAITATGTSTLTTVDINGGAIDGTVIGANSAAAGTFTTLSAGGNVQLGDARSDVSTAASQVTASAGLLIANDPLYVQSNSITDSGGLVITFDGSQTTSFKGAIVGASGYGSGDFTISTDGSGSFAGGLEVGNSGNGLGGLVSFHGVATGEKAHYAPESNIFQVTGSAASGLRVNIGGDETTEYAVDVANGSNNNNKMRAAAFVTYSDESLKQDVASMSSTALDTVMSLNGVEFTWKDSGERDFGFIAQDVQKVVPKAVHTGGDGVQGVDYSRLTSVLVEAVKAQQVQIEELKALLKK